MRPASDTTDDRPGNSERFPTSPRTRPGKPGMSVSRRNRSVPPRPSAASLVDGGLFTDELSLFESLQISPHPDPDPNPNSNPRIFPYSVKQQCWEKAEKIKGRDPDRWRRDPLGNVLFRKLVGCPGCLCHDYDHIIPYSKHSPTISAAKTPQIGTRAKLRVEGSRMTPRSSIWRNSMGTTILDCGDKNASVASAQRPLYCIEGGENYQQVYRPKENADLLHKAHNILILNLSDSILKKMANEDTIG